jgi:ubiquinone biosynthesis protein
MHCGQAPLSDFLRLVASMPRDLAPLIKDTRHGRMRGDLDLKLLDTFGDRVHSAMDRATIGIMTASLVIGSSIVMTVTGGPTVFGVSLLTYCGLVGYLVRVRKQSLGYPFDLTLRTAITEPSGARPEATGKGAW